MMIHHPESPSPPERSPEHQMYLEATGLLIELLEHTIILLDGAIGGSPRIMRRAHCLREMLLSHERRAKVEFIMSDGDRSTFERAFQRGFDPLRAPAVAVA